MLPFGIGVSEMVVIGILAVLLFGSRLPEVAKQVGTAYAQFRKGLAEIQSTIHADLDTSSNSSSASKKTLPEYRDYNEDYEEPSAPKFVPPVDDEEMSVG
jgi:sec-independent protein translocase protein TatA